VRKVSTAAMLDFCSATSTIKPSKLFTIVDTIQLSKPIIAEEPKVQVVQVRLGQVVDGKGGPML